MSKIKKLTIFDIKAGDLAGVPPTAWWTKWICKILGARTFHWFMFVMPDPEGWVITESINKGVSLTRFDYPQAYIYRIKGISEIDPQKLISIVSEYGEYPYDWEVAFKTGIWWLLRHYFGKVISVVRDKQFNCQELVVALAYELGFEIIPPAEYPMSANLENSKALKELGEIK